MSEHHRGAWGSRDDAAAVWWPGALEYQHHQHLLQQQLQAAAQQQQAQQQQDVARSTAAAAAAAQHQLFSYKMASSFQNPTTTTASVSSPVASCVRGPTAPYDYSSGGGRTEAAAAASLVGGAAQWWYSSGMGNPMHGISTPTPPTLPPQQQNRKMPRGKADAKPRGRMTAYACFVQTCREEHKKKHPDENVIFAEFSKKCAERWKTMVDKEKKRFHEMAEKDKERYDAEMETYTPPKGEKAHGRKRKHAKDPNAPKRALSAFFWFCHDERSKVKAQNPEFGVGDIAKELGRRWSEVDPELKAKYEAMAKKDKARYDREMTAYKKRPKQGGQGAATVKKGSEDEDEDEDEDDDVEDGDE
ncbi:high mobility group-T protein-like [Schistocerca americana]|uniref:high mobility group-T protein-like n=1 Tax=Schistocerca americana TaxID=7009 RepID=UPI001F4F7D92|nr:high mobility group-T protein-like [Schistocerca americana]XP_049938210.1 high mobility group-T protein-like [Schistocerca serialis cubense]